MRVLIVDDSAFMRRVLEQMLSSEPGIEVVGTASNGKDGLERAIELKPDVITLDIEMPVLNGLDALRQIRIACRSFHPMVLMCSSLTMRGSDEALKALRLGAADVIGKDPDTVGKKDDGFRRELIDKVRALGERAESRREAKKTATQRISNVHAHGHGHGHEIPPGVSTKPPLLDVDDFDVLAIGSSTGGPPVLEQIITALPANYPLPVVVAQHMPSMFTKSLAQRLDAAAHLPVQLGEDGAMVQRGMVTIIEGGWHARVRRAGQNFSLRLSAEPKSELYKPSVNVLFESLAELCGRRVLGVVLTGMGEDGATGSQAIRKAGGKVLAQDPESCVVYGMPRAVVERGAATAVLTPDQIAETLGRLSAEATGAVRAA